MKNNKLLKYFKTQEQFDAQSIYVEQGSTEDTYIDQNGDQQWGDPDIYPEHICFIEDTKTIFTHNTKYMCASYNSGSCGCGIKETTVFDILKFYNDTTKTFNESYINDNGDEILLSDENGYLLATDILQEMINNEIVFAGVANKHNISINNLNDKIIQVEEQINNTDSSINNLNDKIIQVEEQVNNTDSVELLVNVIYDELCNLVNTNSLLPGQKYRITDYETIVNSSLTDVQSAGHVFDIIVEATDVDKLSENAKAIQSVRDEDGYFTDVNLNAWKLKYCLNNDTNKFDWVDPTNGKGVIYWLKDEWNNECPYDFKNIQFKRVAIVDIDATDITSDLLLYLQTTFIYERNGSICYGQVNNVPGNVLNNSSIINYTFDKHTKKYYYTFTWVDENDMILDASIVGQRLTNDDGQYPGVFNNQILPISQYIFYTESPYEFGYSLNNIVFISNYLYDGGAFYGCYGNKFGVNSYQNTFGNDCNNNTFGNECYYNTFGNHCYNNIFEYNCWCNTFVYGCYNNIFGISCGDITFGNNCCGNTFRNSCYNNIFGINCEGNTLGNNFCYNTFENNCMNNTFGNNCKNNTFGNYLLYNTFGNNCGDNTFINGYIKECCFGDGVRYCTISGYENNRYNYYIRNIVVLNGTKGKYSQLLELNQNNIFNTHNFKPDSNFVPQILCGFSVDENSITYVAKYYMSN